MKKSKIFTLILALLVLLTAVLPVTVFADGNIKIKAPTGASVDKQEFRAYRIFNVETNEEKTGFIYELNTEYKAFESSYTAAGSDLKAYIFSLVDPDTNQLLPGKESELKDLARALWNWSEENNGNASMIATGNTEGVSFSGLAAGYYVVAGESLFSGSSSAATFAALCTVIDDETTNVTFKADAPSIEKEVWNRHSNENNGWEKWTDVSITDEVQFKLTSTVPDTEYYEQYTYKVHDRMSQGLTFKEIISVTAYKNGDPTPLILVNTDTDDGYQLSAIGQVGTDSTFTVTVNSETIKSLSKAGYDKIEIIYSAILNESAVIEREGNPNYVKLEYSNNPNWVWDGVSPIEEGPTGETPEDDAWVYTYKLDIFKYTGDKNTPSPLQGVKFQLFNDVGEQVAMFIKSSDYYVFQGFEAKQTEPAENAQQTEKQAYQEYLERTVLETDSDGMIYMVGIRQAGYILSEFKALQGYNPVDDIDVTVYNGKLDDFNNIKELVEYLNEQRGEDNTGASLIKYADSTAERVDVYNGTGSIFPGTGGIGIYIFYAVGATLTAGLVTYFVVRRKRNILKVK